VAMVSASSSRSLRHSADFLESAVPRIGGL
jgi:hypothetical protein